MLLTLDAWRDKVAFKLGEYDPDKDIMIKERLIRESASLFVEVVFFLAAIVTLSARDVLGRYVVYGLVAVPIVLAGASLHAYIQKFRLLRSKNNDNDNERPSI